MSLSTESVHVIASLLKISPVLESLVVQLCQDVENSDKSESDEASDFGSESEEEMELALHSGETTLGLEGQFTSTMKQLKFVEISGLEGSDSELKFIEILLKNAMVLQKLVLKKDPTGSSIEDITKFCEEVDKFPVACLSLKIYFFFFNL
ncbi:hypothetical protein C5167_012916 [Papaver somniferum]|uniref:FBD domain-containing protein n=2 Tax=Papaver somniferum TaxID=3469 RepID=A0A4Y7J0T7_PAPSO|nr:hypothetical protein C5167_012916 [Papaver somniferum]